jgi:hypothetical protein
MADLVTWEKVQDRLNLDDSEETNVASLISAASAVADSYTGRNLAASTYTLYLDGTGRTILQLPDWPINTITSVNVDTNRSYSDSSLITDYLSYDEIGLLRRESGWPEVPQAIKIVCNLGYNPVPADLENAAIELVAYYRARQRTDAIGIRSITSPDGINTAFELDMPLAARHILDRYRRVEV